MSRCLSCVSPGFVWVLAAFALALTMVVLFILEVAGERATTATNEAIDEVKSRAPCDIEENFVLSAGDGREQVRVPRLFWFCRGAFTTVVYVVGAQVRCREDKYGCIWTMYSARVAGIFCRTGRRRLAFGSVGQMMSLILLVQETLGAHQVEELSENVGAAPPGLQAFLSHRSLGSAPPGLQAFSSHRSLGWGFSRAVQGINRFFVSCAGYQSCRRRG